MTTDAIDGPTQTTPPRVWTLPNQLTASRLGLSIILFVAMSFGWFGTAFVLFVVAASTDWLDGYFARRWGLVTQLGRILDPFADKLIICGTFIYLAAIPASGITPWMAVVVMGREMLVTGLRSFLEQRGKDFSAAWSGKVKMVLQCVAAGMSLFYLAWRPEWLWQPLVIAAWLAVGSTVYSGIGYIQRAIRLFQQ
ncbi:MAG: CDP-diacylglycerol--glycerol-3-phosphate 3-phosphatidyltransferase [Planctomycetales bacterium]|nr:CDP-diacylglycerol--glycerol-3-phosphate 3-phosphatidyltransferase [Planctomycetales bacterium]